jgi:thymidylate synthase (FAD)
MMTTFDELRWKKFPVGSDGFICLVDAMGNDAAIVQAARVSYGKDARECSACKGAKGFVEDTGAPRPDGSFIETWAECPVCHGSGLEPVPIRNLIRYLMRHRHSTPFEMAELKLLVRVPMDTWRQWIRHRTANVNEYSTRYTEAIDSCATTPPDQWRLQSGSNKQGSDGVVTEWPEGMDVYHFQSGYYVTGNYDDDYGGFETPPTPGEYLSYIEKQKHHLDRQIYEERLRFGVAREQARKDLPLSTYTEAYWKIDLHNLLHFLGLRMDSHAQLEIREYATIIGEQIVKPLFPVVWEAFTDYRLEGMHLSRLDVEMTQSIVHEDDRSMAFYHHCQGHPFSDNGWDKDKCRERDECKAKLERMGLL